jgi:hypothetical protein
MAFIVVYDANAMYGNTLRDLLIRIDGADLARYLESGSGAKETRTPDPLVANNRQHVHRQPSAQVTVPGRDLDPCRSRSVAVLLCCTRAQDQGTVPRDTTHVTGWPVT